MKAPRNYLKRVEQRRVFWLFMPPALVVLLLVSWLERTYLNPPPAVEAPQVDTAMKEDLVNRSVADAVVIEADPEPFVEVADEVGASLRALEQVRDDTVFRSGDDEAWFQIWMTLRSGKEAALDRSKAREVSFIELFGQPRSFRGKRVTFQGTIRRLQRVKAPANQYNIDGYWQAWIAPEGGPDSPIVVYFLEIPENFPTGMKIEEPVRVVGYFFKRWAYNAADTIRLTPLVMAFEPIWEPVLPLTPSHNSLSTTALVTMAVFVILTFWGIRWANQGPRKTPRKEPTALASTLANIELFSPTESLRRLSEADKTIEPDPPQGLFPQ
ncbi:MAG: hypothetical protein DWI25_01065 [Planctomycetota bacterium]|nr:MAG: hypothetical protein DWI25_01065 [Planctomycetota bacterium]